MGDTQHIPTEITNSWDTEGFAAVVSKIRQSQGGLLLGQEISGPSTRRLIYEVFVHYLQGNLQLQQVESVLTHEDVASIEKFQDLVADVLWVFGAQYFGDKEGPPDNVKNLVQKVATLPGYSEPLLSRLDFNFIQKAIDPTFIKRYVKQNTHWNLSQVKYNLFREESEGYSKLITELNQPITPQNIVRVINNVKSIIGYFSLDPNRVLSVVLSSYQNNVTNDVYMQLVNIFSEANLPHLLGFKFQQYKNAETPSALYNLAAKFIQQGRVSLAQIYPHLWPTDEQMSENIASRAAQASKEAKNQRSTKWAATLSEKHHREDSKRKEKDNWRETQRRFLERNQKLGLCAKLMENNCWASALKMLVCLAPYQPVTYRPIAEQLTKRVSGIIYPIYDKYCSLKNKILAPKDDAMAIELDISDLHTIQKEAFPLVESLGVMVCSNTSLTVKFCRVIVYFLSNLPDAPAKALHGPLAGLLARNILPGLSLQSPNPHLSSELWTLCKILDWPLRHKIYACWLQNQDWPDLVVVKALSKRLTRKSLK